jgi:hypothetical protein
MITWISLAVSIGFNILGIWYIKELLKRFSHQNMLASHIYERFSVYEEHLSSVYNRDIFYGDSTLEGLLDHTKDLKNEVGEYKNIFSVLEIESEERLDEEQKEN